MVTKEAGEISVIVQAVLQGVSDELLIAEVHRRGNKA